MEQKDRQGSSDHISDVSLRQHSLNLYLYGEKIY